ncbi:tolloid-like protein 1, partial [Actinia tenebrosa]|uniref:Tolloid-like protein 1 n=1 Tax=Actinia tenebrosa TaxID=6105 RepID=A0A6P8I8S9_ACTTE
FPEPDSTICSPFNTFYQNNNIQVSGSSGYIKSPLYGTKYPSNMQCTWVITVPNGNKIKLTFSDFRVGERFYGCSPSHDFVEIRDGEFDVSAILGQYCSSSRPSPVYSSGRHMWIRFNSNSDNYLDKQYAQEKNGFRASYEVIKLEEALQVVVKWHSQ